MPNQATATARAVGSEFVGRLARFFPEATPVRIPVRLSRVHSQADTKDHVKENASAGGSGNGWGTSQETVIEFGTPHEVLFAVTQPLEFADRVLLESKDGSLRAEASVVAVQYHLERTVVAARFVKNVPNWIVKS